MNTKYSFANSPAASTNHNNDFSLRVPVHNRKSCKKTPQHKIARTEKLDEE